MVVLEKITEMKREGMPTNQIIQNLKEQGISPKEINESLSQSEIKSEITQENVFPETPEMHLNPAVNNMGQPQNFPNQQPNLDIPQRPIPPEQITQQATPQATPQTNSSVEMQPSLGSSPQAQPITQEYQQPELPQQASYQQEPVSQLQTQGFPTQEIDQGVQPPVQEFSQPEYGQDQGYSDYSYPEYQPSQSTDIETINDISSQIVEEKTKDFKKELASSTRFKKETEDKVKELNNRLTKIETILEELQIAIIRKIGGYGEDIKNLSKEMKATQNSFSKIVDPLTDNIKELQKITGHEAPETQNMKSSSSKPTTTKLKTEKPKKSGSFEDYLR